MFKTMRLSVVWAGVALGVVGGCGDAEAPEAGVARSFDGRALSASRWSTSASMGSARGLHTATLLDSGLVLVAGGTTGAGTSGLTRSAELYNPYSDTWSGTGSLNVPHQNFAGVRLDSGKVLVAGGQDGSGAPSSSIAELYDPASGVWSLTGALVVPRSFFTLTRLDSGKVLASGGMTPAGGLSTSAELYDPATGTWSLVGSLSTSRFSHTATQLYSGEVLVLGGLGTVTNTVELFSPATNTWRQVRPMPVTRAGHTATRLFSGYVMVAGGFDPGTRGNPVLSSVDVYDPYNDRWFSVPPMNRPRRDHTAVLLYSGALLVTGGTNGTTLETSTEVYDPQSNRWFTIDHMPAPRTGHTATLLDTGAVQLIGSTGEGVSPPSSMRFTP
ncbi:galactose oxidase-like protein [Archangium gephyra]|uniref:Branched-chain amino acid ABC transporter, amino acid-binding protein n=1 Tax=Archangium gephyra TaxID=48 RepID=A0AAC8Q3S5_9BACT|nr:kelch repeat-containing protein [Archangium gephyra]AKJ00604.1 Branched-chain amino acid ABC transporter, amino acid-binding protein [Archangium gephyra]REG20654.1 galactose oxidase-like protein [Archangium gephyra]